MSINLCRVAFRGINGSFNAILAPATAAGFATKFSHRRIPQPCQPQKRTFLHYIFPEFKVKKMLDKCNERSKIIVFEGNIACGKSTAAKELAERLGMRHMPEATVQYFPIRNLGQPVEDRFVGDVSLDKFYADPFSKDFHAFNFQMMMYYNRYFQMCDAIRHVIETAQGVVLERSVYSDFVFLEATKNWGCIENRHIKLYDELVYNSLYKLVPPHLVIYLDVPAEKSLENIKKRAIPMEQNITIEYLQHIEEAYKQKYLPGAVEKSKVLEYDWTNKLNNVERIVEDIDLMTQDEWDTIEWQEQSDVMVTRLWKFIKDDMAVCRSFFLNQEYPEWSHKGKELDWLLEDYSQKYKPRPQNFKEAFNVMLGRKMQGLNKSQP